MSNSTGTRIVGKVYGDLTGSVFEPTVVGLRNVPISATPPLNNQTLMYVAASGSYIPAYVSGSGGSGEAYDQSLNTTDNVVFTNITLSSSAGKLILGQNYDDSIPNLYLAVGDGSSPSSKNNVFYVSDAGTYTKNTVYGKSGYFTGDITVQGTASIGVVNTISQSSLYVGDKFITMASGAATHDELDDSGIKWGTGSAEGETIDAGVHAYIKYNWISGSTPIDRIQIYPGVLSNAISGTVISGTYYGDGSNLDGVIKSLTGYATQEYVTSSITSALNPYLTSEAASGTFISSSQLSTYLTKDEASGTFISASQLSTDYLTKIEASGTFVSASQIAGYALLNSNNTFSGNINLTGVLDLYTTGSYRINHLAYATGTALFIGTATSITGGFNNTFIRSRSSYTTFIADVSGGLTAGNQTYPTTVQGNALNLVGLSNTYLYATTTGGNTNIGNFSNIANNVYIGNTLYGRNIVLGVSGSSIPSGATRYTVQVSGALLTNSTASFGGPLTGTNAYFSNNVTIAGTASIAQLNTISQTNLIVGDKYITILSGGIDHSGIDGAGLLWGSGSSSGPTTGALGEHAHIFFRDSGDILEIYPGISSSYVRISELTSSFVSSSYITGAFYGNGDSLISLPYDLAGQKVGKAVADEYIYRMIAVRPFTIYANSNQSYFSASVAATAQSDLYIYKNSTIVWTASYAPGATAASLAWPSSAIQNFSVGDTLSVVASTNDSTLQDIYFTIKGKTA